MQWFTYPSNSIYVITMTRKSAVGPPLFEILDNVLFNHSNWKSILKQDDSRNEKLIDARNHHVKIMKNLSCCAPSNVSRCIQWRCYFKRATGLRSDRIYKLIIKKTLSHHGSRLLRACM